MTYNADRRTTRARKAAIVVCFLILAAVLTIGAYFATRDAEDRSGPDRSRPAPSGSPAAAAPDFSWSTYQGVQLPVSQQVGPESTEGGRASGFARSDLGAAIAAAHLSVRAGPGPGPSVYQATIAQQVVGPYKAALAERVDGDYAAARVESGVGDGQPLVSCASSSF